jgi:hypothetical protein
MESEVQKIDGKNGVERENVSRLFLPLRTLLKDQMGGRN